MKTCLCALLLLALPLTAIAQKKQSTQTQTQVGDTPYYITLPTDYLLETTRGPDFNVYYFRPKDSLVAGAFTGGIYFGNHPHELEPDNKQCSTEKLKSPFLNEPREWKIFNCTEFDAQVMVDTGNDNFIHAFGHGKTRTDLDRVLKIYATLKKH